MGFRLLKRFFPLCALCLVFALFSCSRAEPRITYGFISLVYYQNLDKIDERFSFFILPEDDDGLENLEELYLYHDREQLRWKLNSDDWMNYAHDGKTWIGSWALALESGESLPRGQYRAVLINKGGERTQRNFSFDAPEESRFPFPTFEVENGSYVVNSSYPDNRLVCYDGQGKYVATINLPTLTGSISSLRIPNSARSAALWAEDPLYFTSAMTEAVVVR